MGEHRQDVAALPLQSLDVCDVSEEFDSADEHALIVDERGSGQRNSDGLAVLVPHRDLARSDSLMLTEHLTQQGAGIHV